MKAVFRTKLTGGPWLDAVVTLEKPGWIAAGYASDLITHGAQLAPKGVLRLRALPVLDGLGDWAIVSEKKQAVSVRFEPREPAEIPPFVPFPECKVGCVPLPDPKPMSLSFESEPRKALSFPYSGLIVLDPDFWEGIESVAGRLAIIGHELGHLLGAECQQCADFYAGAYLNAFGISYRDAVRAFDSFIKTRNDAAFSLAYGGIYNDQG